MTFVVGGLVSIGLGQITNSVNCGQFIFNNLSYAGGLSYNTVDVYNSYSTVEGQSGSNGVICTMEQINNKLFHSEVLGLDETIWNLDNIDIVNGKYPTLRCFE